MNYLVTGVSGSGKSTVAEALNIAGQTAYDIDYVPGLARWEDKEGIPAIKPVEADKRWYKDHFWNWNAQKLTDLLNQPDDVFICGVSDNQSRFYPIFSKIFLLSIDSEQMLQRLDHRTNNSFGKSKAEQDTLLKWRPRFEKEALGSGAVAVDAAKPLELVVNQIITVAHERPEVSAAITA